MGSKEVEGLVCLLRIRVGSMAGSGSGSGAVKMRRWVVRLAITGFLEILVNESVENWKWR